MDGHAHMPACAYANVQYFQVAYWASCYSPADGRIYLSPRCATRAVSFDPVTKTWEAFGDTFPETSICATEAFAGPSVSTFDNRSRAWRLPGGVFFEVLEPEVIMWRAPG